VADLDATVAGLPIDDGLPEGYVPLAAVLCVKALAPDGHEEHLTRATPDLCTVEAFGMAHLLVLHLSRALGDVDEEG
jgi:hypothetical protein